MIHSFPMMYILGGGRCGRNGSNQGFRPKIRPKTRFFWRTQILIISLQSDLGRPIFKLTPISMCSLKSMGKNLQNELWARPVASKLSEWRPPTLFLGADTENGQKMYFFAFLPITQMQKFSRGIRGCQMKADVLEVQKMW